jgi:hypothetical protein
LSKKQKRDSAKQNGEPKMLGGCTGKGWTPGISGNPKGRARTSKLSAAIRAKLDSILPGDPNERTLAMVLADQVADMALSGDLEAIKYMNDRAEGKAFQSIANFDAGSIEKQISSMTTEEMQSRVVELMTKMQENGKAVE